VFNISTVFASILAVGTILIYGRGFSLQDLGNHKKAEHDASLVHADTPEGEKFAPSAVQQDMLEKLIDDCQTQTDYSARGEKEGEKYLDEIAAARARVRREKECKRELNSIRKEIAVGEMALVLGILGKEVGDKAVVPAKWIREFMGDERIPGDWKPSRVMGLLDAKRNAQAIKAAMKGQRQTK
jgi:hypothetical protein